MLGSFEARARVDETAAGVVFLGEWAGDVPALMVVLRPSVAADAVALDRFQAAVDALPEDRAALGAMPRGLVAWAAVPAGARDDAIALLRAARTETAEVRVAQTSEDSPKLAVDSPEPAVDSPEPAVDSPEVAVDSSESAEMSARDWAIVFGFLAAVASWPVLLVFVLVQLFR
ncbi:hypothetical protein [Actinomadura sp. 9N215]|uniref:hypothetical protein n=1 Tax=Actinomadura sp. 9N215 TaxID=3375150 RepID=UPI0037A9E91C